MTVIYVPRAVPNKQRISLLFPNALSGAARSRVRNLSRTDQERPSKFRLDLSPRRLVFKTCLGRSESNNCLGGRNLSEIVRVRNLYIRGSKPTRKTLNLHGRLKTCIRGSKPVWDGSRAAQHVSNCFISSGVSAHRRSSTDSKNAFTTCAYRTQIQQMYGYNRIWYRYIYICLSMYLSICPYFSIHQPIHIYIYICLYVHIYIEYM